MKNKNIVKITSSLGADHNTSVRLWNKRLWVRVPLQKLNNLLVKANFNHITIFRTTLKDVGVVSFCWPWTFMHAVDWLADIYLVGLWSSVKYLWWTFFTKIAYCFWHDKKRERRYICSESWSILPQPWTLAGFNLLINWIIIIPWNFHFCIWKVGRN